MAYMVYTYVYVCIHPYIYVVVCTYIINIHPLSSITYMCMEIHVASMLAIGVETINKQTQQTNKQPQWLIKFIKHSHKGLRKY